jgi:quinol-cytochrome oxidoreductase complex cytochrome b subunit
MIDEEEDPKLPQPAGEHDGELLLYDFFKHLTGLVLLTLGGLLIVIKDFDPKDVKPVFVVAAIVLIATAGVLSYSGSSEIVRARYTRTKTNRSLQISRIGAPVLLSIGFGLFLAMFIDSLD